MIYDVVIIGGGPAGTAAGITLRKYTSLNVLLLESGDLTGIRVGETVSPGILPLLRYLDQEVPFLQDKHLASYSQAAAWGSDLLFESEHMLAGRGNGWHLDRTLFDNMLLNGYCDKGGTVFKKMQLISAQIIADNSWQLVAKHHNARNDTFYARYVIDATGRKAVFSRNRSVKRVLKDHLVGITAFFTTEDQLPQRILLETTRLGWWYSATLPGNKLVVAFMTDADIARHHKLHEIKHWESWLAQSHYIHHMVAQRHPYTGLIVRPAQTHLLEQTYGNAWIAAGDAAAAYDPVSSLGIGNAISSGIHAARCVAAALKGNDSLLEDYHQHVIQNMNEYLSIRQHYYRQEMRWPNDIFWARRQKTQF